MDVVGIMISVESGSMFVGPGTNGTLVQCAYMAVVFDGFSNSTSVVKEMAVLPREKVSVSTMPVVGSVMEVITHVA